MVSPVSGTNNNEGNDPQVFTDANGIAFFTADDGIHGSELWKSDGTEAGTVLVKDINPGSSSSMPFAFNQDYNHVNFNDELFFMANDGVHGLELWKSDGTEAGTIMVKDIRLGAGNSNETVTSSPLPYELTVIGENLFFKATNGVHGLELWKSDGTETGTVMVKDIDPVGFATDSQPRKFTDLNGTVFFQASNDTNGTELWKSDGTDSGTVLVKDIVPGSSTSAPDELTNVNGTLFFEAIDVNSNSSLWKSDGTEAGTLQVKNISPNGLTSVNGLLFFTAHQGSTGGELWKSDGSESGTVLVKDIWSGASGSNPENLTNVDGVLFFSTSVGSPNGSELWKSDGTETGTVLVKDIRLPGSSSPEELTNVNGTLFFIATDNTNGNELWKSDGTETGTVLVKDINPGIDDSDPFGLANIDGSLFFGASDGINANAIWKTIEDTTAPTVSNLALSTNPKTVQETSVLSANVTDADSGVATVEYFIGNDPGQGNGTSMNFDGSTATVDIGTNLSPNTYVVSVRAQDNAGNWSQISTIDLVVYEPTFSLNPIADTYVRSGQANRNRGGEQYMNVQPSGDNRGLVKFDQSAIQSTVGDGMVLSAKLQLTITDNGNNWGSTGRTVDVHRMLLDWSEGNGTDNDRGAGSGATWNCAIDNIIENMAKNCSGSTEWEMAQPNNPSVHPWAEAATATQTIINDQSGIVEYDVTGDVQSFVNGTFDNYGWIIKRTNEGQPGQVSFGTKESSFAAELIITYQL